ncbi:MAG: hypothetical protein RBS19_01220 [Bacteroidales bacterium]|nr:hypothetical protein [Bacteroidales bacterium]
MLKAIFNSLSEEERLKEIIIRPSTDEIGKLFKEKISMFQTNLVEGKYIAGIGYIDKVEKEINFVYRNFHKEIVIKPKVIEHFLNNNNNNDFPQQ